MLDHHQNPARCRYRIRRLYLLLSLRLLPELVGVVANRNNNGIHAPRCHITSHSHPLDPPRWRQNAAREAIPQMQGDRKLRLLLRDREKGIRAFDGLGVKACEASFSLVKWLKRNRRRHHCRPPTLQPSVAPSSVRHLHHSTNSQGQKYPCLRNSHRGRLPQPPPTPGRRNCRSWS